MLEKLQDVLEKAHRLCKLENQDAQLEKRMQVQKQLTSRSPQILIG